MLKKILVGLAALVVVVLLAAGGFVFSKASAFDASMAKVYEVPLPAVTLSDDPAVLERGKHLASSLGGCHGCHGPDFAGGKKEDLGPLGALTYPNITKGKGGRGAEYSDAEIARLIKHGLKRDGRGARFMPSDEFAWWPDEDVVAVISYLRTAAPVDGQPAVAEFSTFAKVLDRLDMIPLDAARKINHASLPKAVAPAATAEYGALLASGCKGCHGEKFSGGRIPGTPDTMPAPLNLTPHETGLAAYTVDDFKKVLREGVRKNGKKLDPFMPIEMTKNMNDTETEALYAYLRTLPPTPLGNR